jgi:hypothetical protein
VLGDGDGGGSDDDGNDDDDGDDVRGLLDFEKTADAGAAVAWMDGRCVTMMMMMMMMMMNMIRQRRTITLSGPRRTWFHIQSYTDCGGPGNHGLAPACDTRSRGMATD